MFDTCTVLSFKDPSRKGGSSIKNCSTGEEVDVQNLLSAHS